MDELERRIYELLLIPLKPDELSRRLSGISRRSIAAALEHLTEDGYILRTKKNKIGRIEAFGCLAGIFSATQHRFSFVTPTGAKGEDVFIPPRCDGGAWHGDRVLVRLSEKPGRVRDGKSRQEGEVLRILERSRKDITGTVEKRGRALFLSPDSPKYPQIELVKNRLNGVQPGDAAAVRLVFWGDNKKRLPPQAVVTEVFGAAGTMQSSIRTALHENGIFEEFPQEVLAQAEALPEAVPTEVTAEREDLRELGVFTIDGDDAKDFDDAVSLELLEGGRMQLGVHIADVSHYVTYGSPLDSEAYRRGTSVYYPGNVVPMLPLALSNGICSLNPQVDRYAFSAFMELDQDGRRHRCRFVKSIIRSCARMTYRKVNAVLAGETVEGYMEQAETLKKMDALAKVLRARRMARGALDLDIPEAQITLDETGSVSGVEYRSRGDAERMIEEFMLLANEAVAEYLCKREHPTVYRIHEDPDPEKLRAFAQYARLFGYRVDASKSKDTKQLQAVLDGAAGKPDQRVLPTLLLRSLSRARYAENCTGHYGLHAKYYLHFTSPIRRYPDLVVHRMLYKAVSGQEFTRADTVFCEEAAAQSTLREQAADAAERTIDKLFMADYMSQFIGEEFDAAVSGVTSFGIFIVLQNGVEGLIRIEDLQGDGYTFDPDRMTLTASKSGRRFAIGTPVRARLLAASNVTGQIDFALADMGGAV